MEAWAMAVVGCAVLAAGLVLAWPRYRAASGVERILVFGPVCEAVPLAMFSAEHFFSARGMAGMVPGWIPWHLFWVWFVGVGLMAAAVSLIAWRCVRWSALLLAVMFGIFVVTMDGPLVMHHLHQRISWTYAARELVFGAGALVLAGSTWPRESMPARWMTTLGRGIVALTMIFYAMQHFLFPRFVPGVPLEKLTPGWMPAPVAISYVVGLTLLGGGVALFMRPLIRIAAAVSGGAVMLLTAFFYVPIFLTEMHTALAVDGLNYIGDTMLFGATVLLAGFGAEKAARPWLVQEGHRRDKSVEVKLMAGDRE